MDREREREEGKEEEFLTLVLQLSNKEQRRYTLHK